MSPAIRLGESTDQTSQLQTLTISSTSSVYPVRSTGRGKPLTYNKGARTFAGSMVFTVLGADPFQRIMNIDAMSNTVRGDGHWWIDQMAPFDAVILCVNEMGETGLQVIFDITLTNWGTTYSVEDLYIESSYTYVAEHVTPFISQRVAKIEDLSIVDQLASSLKAGGKGDNAAADSVLQRLRQDHVDRYGPYTAPFFQDLIVGNEVYKKQFWSDLADQNVDIAGLLKPGTISATERFQRTFGGSPELPVFYTF
jgi:hypothetical protein